MSNGHHANNSLDNPYRLVTGRYGRYLINPQDEYVGKSLLKYGEYSQQECDVLSKLVPEGGVVVEVGANIGSITLPMAQKAGRNGLVFAFEPQVLVFQLLCANMALNQLMNVQCINSGCGQTASTEKLRRLDPSKPLNHAGLTLEQLKSDTGAEIAIDVLDDRIDPPRLDLIKADVEGMEYDVLKGADNLIRKHSPILYVENLDAAKSPDLISLIQGFDYDLWWHMPPMFNPRNFNSDLENVFGTIVSINMLCVHKSNTLPISGGKPVADTQEHPSNW